MGEARERSPRGRRDQRASEMEALREAALFGVLIGGIVLINAVLGLVLLEVFGSFDVRPPATPEGPAITPTA